MPDPLPGSAASRHHIERLPMWRCSCGFETTIAMRAARHRKEHDAK